MHQDLQQVGEILVLQIIRMIMLCARVINQLESESIFIWNMLCKQTSYNYFATEFHFYTEKIFITLNALISKLSKILYLMNDVFLD